MKGPQLKFKRTDGGEYPIPIEKELTDEGINIQAVRKETEKLKQRVGILSNGMCFFSSTFCNSTGIDMI